jgi:amino acid transporter
VRALGRWDLVFVTVNSTVGAGIFGLPGKVYALLGPYSIFTCVAGGFTHVAASERKHVLF